MPLVPSAVLGVSPREACGSGSADGQLIESEEFTYLMEKAPAAAQATASEKRAEHEFLKAAL